MYVPKVAPRSQSDITPTSRPAVSWGVVFVILALVLPFTMFGILCFLFPDFRRHGDRHAIDPEKQLEFSKIRSKGGQQLARFAEGIMKYFYCNGVKLPSRIRSGRHGTQALSLSTTFDDLSERRYNAWDTSYFGNGAEYMSGAVVGPNRSSQNTARRRGRRRNDERTSSFFHEMARNAVTKILLPDGSNRYSSRNTESANDLEVGVASTETTPSRPRGFSLPIMPSTSSMFKASQSKSEDAPPNESNDFSAFNTEPHKVQIVPSSMSSLETSYYLPEPATAAYNYHALALDGCVEGPSNMNARLEHQPRKSHRSHSWNSSVTSTLDIPTLDIPTLDIPKQRNLDDAFELQSLRNYEAESSIDGAVDSRLPSDATTSFYNPEHRKVYEPPLPDYSMSGFYNIPISVLQYGQHDWQLSPSQAMTNTPFDTARTHLAPNTECPRTPSRCFPLRRLQHRHSDSSLNERRFPYEASLFDANDYPLEPPASLGRKMRVRRNTKMSPVPKEPMLFFDGACDEGLDIPRKRPLSARRQEEEPDAGRDYTIDDLPSGSSPKGALAGNPFAVRDKARNLSGEVVESPEYPGRTAAAARGSPIPFTPPPRRPTYMTNASTGSSSPATSRTTSRSPSPYVSSPISLSGEKVDFETQKRQFSGPAERERSLRRLRRVGGKVGGKIGGRSGLQKFGLHTQGSLMGESGRDGGNGGNGGNGGGTVEMERVGKGGEDGKSTVGTMSTIAVDSEEVEMGQNRRVGGTEGRGDTDGILGGVGDGGEYDGNGELRRSLTHKREGQKILGSEGLGEGLGAVVTEGE
ncbi:uncharacterized protein KY384_003008 [Bacidia gigantensis]|uniref:uncharacterized protein n=1 Tax=Bacidia gigantensis TaxID=2732470 RepID=UPI001D046939|nr:uncharacterized protein KY384_003008 [Bacidia gigantensis]KAG8531379.1 hypothetical protein KY384_003008 [Bacidia gigantensis]